MHDDEKPMTDRELRERLRDIHRRLEDVQSEFNFPSVLSIVLIILLMQGCKP